MASSEGVVRLGVLISGSGRTLQNLIDQIGDGQLRCAQIAIVISSLSKALGVERARKVRLPVVIIRKKDFPNLDAFSRQIVQTLDEHGVDLVVQAGFACYWKLPDRYLGRAMNIHPALLPRFGGKGFYGHHVHEAVLAAGCKVSGCTVHFVDNEYDHGPIIVQRCVPILEDDTPETLADRVFEQELIAYPEAIRLFAADRLHIDGQRVRVLPAVQQ